MAKKKTRKKTAKKKVTRKKRTKKTHKKVAVESYRHESATRKNIPTAKIAAEGIVPRVAKAKYSYSAHLSPELRFDASGQCDRVSEIVEKAAAGNKLTKEEAGILRGIAANASQPWLEWSGKKEEHDRGVLEVEPVALHIHERVSANAIIRAAKREDVQADLFADPKQEYKEAIGFYKYDVDWANRLILGDSLEVMSSLSIREGMSGKVQMIFLDPPYGIKFASNFQSELGRTKVEEKERDLSREPEMIKAYRDTWSLGIHSYISYLRDRLLVSRLLLADTGSIFVQISDENCHRVKVLLEEIFGVDNYCGTIRFRRGGFQTSDLLPETHDFVLWFCKDRSSLAANKIYKVADKKSAFPGQTLYDQRKDGSYQTVKRSELEGIDTKVFRHRAAYSATGSESSRFQVKYQGKSFLPSGSRGWSTNAEGMRRLALSDRLFVSGNTLERKMFFEDFPLTYITTNWEDTISSGFGDEKVYVVQTQSSVIERCMLMATRPGDLILDPTCGSGTTAFVAEKWGRRWITIDSSRVALSVARQRLLTSSFEYFSVRGSVSGENAGLGADPSAGFVYATSPQITLRSIARNSSLDSIFEKYRGLLNQAFLEIRGAISDLGRSGLASGVEKLAEKLQVEGFRAVKKADQRRWLLPGVESKMIAAAFRDKPRLKQKHVAEYASLVPSIEDFEEWHIPFDVDNDWPDKLKFSVIEYRDTWRRRMDEVDQCIEANADQVELVNQPAIVEDFVRVTGPFTVEGVRPEELALDENGELFNSTPNEFEVNDEQGGYAQNASAYLDRMLQLISQDGITFPNNEHRKFELLERLEETDSALHAEALWVGAEDGDQPNIAIAFGPQHGPVTASQVEDLIRASRRYDELVIAAFSFDGSSQAVLQESANPRLKIHMAHIRPDVSPGMDGLLKDSPKSQLFTVFGQPDITLHETDGAIKVELLGVDIYSPLSGEITSSGASKVAAWFLDSDYDGRCFCITQAFFPNQKAWDKIAKALGSSADAESFDAYNGTVSVPFEPGEHQRIAVKVIDPRGNEVMAIRSLKDAT